MSTHIGRVTAKARSGIDRHASTAVAVVFDRAMICGNLAFNLELKAMLEAAGLEEGANSKPAQYVVEKAFLD